ncbi:MAG: TIGR01212 family radical SAM protein [Clostridia bacterium]|nr:TIGR01212 family radical SAM protein [Clostridia bacterium]
MENIERYKHLNKYLKNKFGERTLKICIDGGFTCPNRDGTSGLNGCIFCSERGSGEHIECSSIFKQIQNYFASYKAERANKFIAYFQNFTNTYAPVDLLKEKYDSALIDDRIVALAIATRPDCINEDICKLLKSYTNKYHVWVELGLQTANNSTGKLINRCYSNEQFSEAVALLNKYNIDVVTHIMIGLPGENFEDLKNTVDFINSHNIQGLKIHCTYVVENTILADMYKNGDYEPISLDYYLECVAYVLTHISPDIVIHRVSGDAPKYLLLAPEWNCHKKWIVNGLDKLLREQNLYQGMYYEKSHGDK